jgi:hypothetical protein
MEAYKETLKEEIIKAVEKDAVVILVINHRSSESLYNYKTKKLYVIFKAKYPAYEDVLVRDVQVIQVATGAYQEYSTSDIEDITEELREHYIIQEVEIY